MTTKIVPTARPGVKLKTVIFDTDFFHDPKIISLTCKYGSNGIVAYLRIIMTAAHGCGMLDEEGCIIQIRESGVGDDAYQLLEYLVTKELLYRQDGGWYGSHRLDKEVDNVLIKRQEWALKKRAQRAVPLDIPQCPLGTTPNVPQGQGGMSPKEKEGKLGDKRGECEGGEKGEENQTTLKAPPGSSKFVIDAYANLQPPTPEDLRDNRHIVGGRLRMRNYEFCWFTPGELATVLEDWSSVTTRSQFSLGFKLLNDFLATPNVNGGKRKMSAMAAALGPIRTTLATREADKARLQRLSQQGGGGGIGSGAKTEIRPYSVRQGAGYSEGHGPKSVGSVLTTIMAAAKRGSGET